MDRSHSSSSHGAALRRTESYQYPATHLGHLSDSQAKSLASFKELSQQKGYYRPETSEKGPSHDDETMLRYLRARKFVPDEAFKQFKDTEDWRRSEKIDQLYETIDVQEYDETRRLYPQWTGRRDKRGIPVYVFEVSHLTSKRMSACEKSIANSTSPGKTSPKLIRLFALYENLLRFTMPLCSGIPDRPYAETPVSQSNNIVDISGVGLKQFWNLRQHMQDASQLATAHYPETLDRIFVIGAPSFFPTVWSWIKGWFDPITVSKIFVLSKDDMKHTLETYIDRSNIPVKYGGTLDWQWGSLPDLEPAIDKALKWKKPEKTSSGGRAFPSGPIKWERDSENSLVAVAVGSVNGRRRKDVIAQLPVQEGLSLGPLATRLSKMSTSPANADRQPAAHNEQVDPMFGHPSTSGTHTHPPTGQEYFPTSGMTPPDEAEDALAKHGGSSAAQADHAVGEGSYASEGHYAVGEVLDGPAPARTGTSATRYAQQSSTHAHGQMSEGTPNAVDRGYGDKTTTMEPSTVGQAPKNVDVPDPAPSAESEAQPSYIEQARDAATGAMAAAGALGTTVMAKVGLGGSAEPTKAEEESVEPTTKAEDPRVDKLEDKRIEDFIRGQYTSS